MKIAHTSMHNRPNFTECPDCGNDIQKHGIRYYCSKCQKDILPEDNRKVKKNKNQKSLVKVIDRSKKTEENQQGNKSEDSQKKETPEVAIKTIKQSMSKQKLITFQYAGKDGKKSTRTVEPYKVEQNANGDIIFWAYCTESDGIRRFTVTGMSEVGELDFTYNPRWPIEYLLKDK